MIQIADSVYHRLDPLKRVLTVVKTFNWLGGSKIVVKDGNGEFHKDWDYEFELVN